MEKLLHNQIYIYFFLKEGGGRNKEKEERESQAGSMSSEPDMGLHLTTLRS